MHIGPVIILAVVILLVVFFVIRNRHHVDVSQPLRRGVGLGVFVTWLTVHLVWLIGFRNRMLVLVNWAWNYLTYDRAVRLIRRASSRQHVSNGDEEAP